MTKNEIVIKVEELEDKMCLNVQCDVDLTPRGVFLTIDALMKSLDVDVNWNKPSEAADFCVCMKRSTEGNKQQRLSFPSNLEDMIRGIIE